MGRALDNAMLNVGMKKVASGRLFIRLLNARADEKLLQTASQI